MVERLLERIYNKPTRDILYDMNIKKDMTTRQIAEELTVSIGWVSSALRKYNIYKIDAKKYK